MEKNENFDRFGNWVKRSVTSKLITIGILILILLIPKNMIMKLIDERKERMNQAVDEISSTWGASQIITGPVLTIPYRSFIKTDKGESREIRQYAYFLPANLAISGTIDPDERNRGIYKVVLYHAKLQLAGNFSYPDFSQLNIPEADIFWNEAFVSMGIPDMRGIKERLTIDWNGKVLPFNSETESTDLFSTGVGVRINLNNTQEQANSGTGTKNPALAEDNSKKSYSFSIPLDIKGSKMINFLPIGKTTEVNITSTWSNPGFEGSFLPDTHTISDKGFDARWKILDLNRSLPQSFCSDKFTRTEGSFIPVEFSKYNFGVSLLLPVDQYQITTRSAKYEILFIFLTFLIFFFSEIINKINIHPFQYLLVGFAVTLFYLILLSLSEYLSFNLSYLGASLGILALVSLYSRSVFKSLKLSLILSLVLAILYAFFFVILQLQDYALLFGSLGLFVVLAIVMYLSRNIDWYSARSKPEERRNESNTG